MEASCAESHCELVSEAPNRLKLGTGAPKAEGGPGDSSNITHLWFFTVQNRQGKWPTFLRIFK